MRPIWGGAGTSVKFTGSIVDLIRSESRAQAQAVLKENEVKLTSPAIGHVYIQFRNQYSPTTLYPGTQWANISNLYAGRFFRAEGTVTCSYEHPLQGYYSFSLGTRTYSSSSTMFNTTANGGLQNARLPNISGKFPGNVDDGGAEYTGAFSRGIEEDIGSNGGSGGGYILFDAGYSCWVYGSTSDLPIPPNETFRIWKRTA